MKTTIRINDNLLKRAKKRAAEEGRTLTSLAEDGLLLVLSKAKPKQSKPIKLPVSGSTGGVLPGNDLNNSSALEDAMSEP
jgi:hypothetical protein